MRKIILPILLLLSPVLAKKKAKNIDENKGTLMEFKTRLKYAGAMIAFGAILFTPTLYVWWQKRQESPDKLDILKRKKKELEEDLQEDSSDESSDDKGDSTAIFKQIEELEEDNVVDEMQIEGLEDEEKEGEDSVSLSPNPDTQVVENGQNDPIKTAFVFGRMKSRKLSKRSILEPRDKKKAKAWSNIVAQNKKALANLENEKIRKQKAKKEAAEERRERRIAEKRARIQQRLKQVEELREKDRKRKEEEKKDKKKAIDLRKKKRRKSHKRVDSNLGKVDGKSLYPTLEEVQELKRREAAEKDRKRKEEELKRVKKQIEEEERKKEERDKLEALKVLEEADKQLNKNYEKWGDVKKKKLDKERAKKLLENLPEEIKENIKEEVGESESEEESEEEPQKEEKELLAPMVLKVKNEELEELEEEDEYIKNEKEYREKAYDNYLEKVKKQQEEDKKKLQEAEKIRKRKQEEEDQKNLGFFGWKEKKIEGLQKKKEDKEDEIFRIQNSQLAPNQKKRKIKPIEEEVKRLDYQRKIEQRKVEIAKENDKGLRDLKEKKIGNMLLGYRRQKPNFRGLAVGRMTKNEFIEDISRSNKRLGYVEGENKRLDNNIYTKEEKIRQKNWEKHQSKKLRKREERDKLYSSLKEINRSANYNFSGSQIGDMNYDISELKKMIRKERKNRRPIKDQDDSKMGELPSTNEVKKIVEEGDSSSDDRDMFELDSCEREGLDSIAKNKPRPLKKSIKEELAELDREQERWKFLKR